MKRRHNQIRKNKKEEYLALLAQAQRMKEEREKLANHIGEIQKTLREFLRPYYPEALPEDLRAGVQTLSKELSEWQTLQRRKEQLEEQNAGNLALSQALTGSIRAALSRYQALDETRTLRECTQALCRRFAQYTLSSARAERYFADSRQAQAQKEAAQAELDAFFAAFPAMQGDAGKKLEALERDAGAWALASGQLLSAQQALTTFDREHPAVESMDEEQTLPDPEELQRQEAQAQQKLDALEEKRRALRQERQNISRETEDLSVWEDRIAALCDERQSLQKSCTELTSLGPVSANSSPASVRQSAAISTQSPRQSALPAVRDGSGSVSASFHFLSVEDSFPEQ